MYPATQAQNATSGAVDRGPTKEEIDQLNEYAYRIYIKMQDELFSSILKCEHYICPTITIGFPRAELSYTFYVSRINITIETRNRPPSTAQIYSTFSVDLKDPKCTDMLLNLPKRLSRALPEMIRLHEENMHNIKQKLNSRIDELVKDTAQIIRTNG